MSSESKRKNGSRGKIKTLGDHKEFLKRITKTLYYGELPTIPCLSLPVTEISCELWSGAMRGRSLRRLHADAAAALARRAAVSPCALVLAVLYLERLQRANPRYLAGAAPHDLFLVSLMVGNKFLQDDGEDDEVYCSEWAASGGIDLNLLKKLEVEFLDAIDWKVFVSEAAFAAGLAWLERQVALRQARSRGFFTYGDLRAARASLAAAAAAAALAALAAAAALAALLLAPAATTSTSTAVTTSTAGRAATTPATTSAAAAANTTAYDRILTDDSFVMHNLKCCNGWSRYQEEKLAKRNWYDGIAINDWKSFEPWWSKLSVLNWLYQSVLLNPVQRWLETINLYADFFKKETDIATSKHLRRCNDYAKCDEKQQCVRQWLNLSRLSMFIATVSDR